MRSFDLGNFPIPDTLCLVANYLEQLTAYADSLGQQGHSSFHAQSVPNINIADYLTRLQKYCPANNECYLAVLVYFHRIMRLNEANRFEAPFTVDSYSVHRLLVSGLMAAAKFFSDVFFTNSRYAKVGGVPLSELNRLETQLLVALDFKLAIPVAEFQYYADHLLRDTLSFAPPADAEWALAASSFSDEPTNIIHSGASSSASSISISLTHSNPLTDGGASVDEPITGGSSSLDNYPITPTDATPPSSSTTDLLKSNKPPSTNSNSTTSSSNNPNCFARCLPPSCTTSLPSSYTQHFQASYHHVG